VCVFFLFFKKKQRYVIYANAAQPLLLCLFRSSLRLIAFLISSTTKMRMANGTKKSPGVLQLQRASTVKEPLEEEEVRETGKSPVLLT
jgi:hypothetical protein